MPDHRNETLTDKEKLDGLKRQGEDYFIRANNYYGQFHFAEALDNCAKAAYFFEMAGDLISQADSYLLMGNIYSYVRDHSHSIEVFAKAMSLYEKAGNLRGQGQVCLEMGWTYFNMGDVSRALSLLAKSLLCFRETCDIDGQASVYLKKGRIYYGLKDYGKAIEIYEEALPFVENSGNPRMLGNLYRQKGMAYHDNRDIVSALEMYEKARFCFHQVGDEEMKTEIELYIALIYLDRGDVVGALGILEKNLEYYEKSGNKAGIANVTSIIGDVLLGRGETDRALALVEKTLTFYEEVGDKCGQGRLYSLKGRFCFFAGELAGAMEMYEKALLLLDENIDPVGIGKVYQGKGEVFLYQGNIFQALDMYEKALVFFDKAGFEEGICDVYRGKGYIFSFCGAPLRALDMYDKSLLSCREAGNLPVQVSAAYLGKAVVYCDIKDYPQATKMYDEAYSCLDKVDSPWARGWIYLGKARIYLAIDDFANSEDMCRKALAIFTQLGYPQAFSHVYESMGDIYLTQKQWQKALEIYDKALPVFMEIGDIESLASIELKRGAALLMLGETEEAFALLDESFAHLDRFRKQTAFSQMKRTLMEEIYKRFELVFSVTMYSGYYQRTFKYAELIKARLFLDQLGEGLVKPERGISPDLMQKKDHLVGTLSLLTKRLCDATCVNQRNELKQRYRDTEREYEDLLVKIRLTNPLYASVRYPQPITPRELQTDVLKNGEMLLRYLISGDEVYVFLISTAEFKAITLDVKAKDLGKMVNVYLFSVKKKDNDKMIKYGRDLYLSLFKPLELSLKEVSDIIIAPDGFLTKIPFESFVIETGFHNRPVYLLERYRVKYIQSASVLSILRKYYRREYGYKSFIGFGDPVYDDTNYPSSTSATAEEGLFSPGAGDIVKEIHLAKYRREGGKFNRLQASGEEVQTIAGLFRTYEQEAVVYLREEASEEHVKAPGMKEFAYIHFACHGILGDNFQCLVLSRLAGFAESGEDGFLTLNDIMNCDFNAKLVVLSACQTALGKMEYAEGVTGLTCAVMYAGTPAVVASLWSVSDTGTKELMVKFYTHLLATGMSNEEALRQAKLDMINSGAYSSPYYWSAFIMYGE